MSRLLITIGREYGSGGREIGEKLAERLSIPIYDKQLITEAVQASGICQEVFDQYDETATNSLLYSLVMGTYNVNMPLPIPDQLFLEQFKVIQKLAKKGSCIFIGRCADYVLEENPHLISVFIQGDEEDKIKRIMKRNNISESEAKKRMKSIDKARKTYYERYTNKSWGKTNSYDVTLNSSTFGIDRSVEFLYRMATEVQNT